MDIEKIIQTQKLELGADNKLTACGMWSIHQSQLEKLYEMGYDFFELDASFNPFITNVAFLKNLKKLSARGTCGIDQAGIAGLDLWEINIVNNNKIKDLGFMENLTKCQMVE